MLVMSFFLLLIGIFNCPNEVSTNLQQSVFRHVPGIFSGQAQLMKT
jgi:hypothetical protein